MKTGEIKFYLELSDKDPVYSVLFRGYLHDYYGRILALSILWEPKYKEANFANTNCVGTQ